MGSPAEIELELKKCSHQIEACIPKYSQRVHNTFEKIATWTHLPTLSLKSVAVYEIHIALILFEFGLLKYHNICHYMVELQEGLAIICRVIVKLCFMKIVPIFNFIAR